MDQKPPQLSAADVKEEAQDVLISVVEGLRHSSPAKKAESTVCPVFKWKVKEETVFQDVTEEKLDGSVRLPNPVQAVILGKRVNKFPCSCYPASYTSETYFHKHIKKSHSEEFGPSVILKVHWCSQHGKSFDYLEDQRRHHRIHTGERPYQCSQCGKSFIQISHQKTHTRKRCGKSIGRLRKTEKHQRKQKENTTLCETVNL